MQGRLSRFNIIVISVLTVVLVLATTYLYVATAFKKLAIDHQIDIDIKRGSSLKQIARLLADKTRLEKPGYFVELVRLHGAEKQLRAGHYQIKPGTTMTQFFHQLMGDTPHYYRVSIISGQRFKEVAATFNKNPHLEHHIKHMSPQEVMANLRINHVSPEGLFYPDTYKFASYIPDLTILRMAYVKMQNVLARQWQQRAKNLPYNTPYEALIASSLITKETHYPKERRKIAGVIARRLHRNMPLQIDYTVVYALGATFEPPVTHDDLEIDSPYNTYEYEGLPPTPIAYPTEADIHAALHPDDSDALYYLAKPEGGHVFSATYEQHKKAKASFDNNKAG